MPSPVKFSSCRKILSLNMESSEVDDGKSDTIQDQEKNRTISGQLSKPERLQMNDVAISASPPSTPIIHKDTLICGQKESLVFDYTTYQIDQDGFDEQKSPNFVGLTKMDGSMNSENFNGIEKNTLRIMTTSELNKMSTSLKYSQDGESNQSYLLCQDPIKNGQSIKPVNPSSSLKLHPHDVSASLTFEEIATDAIVESDSGRVEHTPLGKIKETLKKVNLYFHPFKKLNVQKEQKPQFSQPIDVTEEAPKEIDDFLFGVQSVGQDFDWTYMRNFKKMYEEDRWENFSYEIGQDEPNHDAFTPAAPLFN